MDYKALLQIEILRQKNRNPNWVNKDLYRLLFKQELYVCAYEKIKSKPGNMTEGIDGTTIDGFSVSTIDRLITSMKDESFQFTPARRVLIPKPKGGTRPLGIPTAKDKIVQEGIRVILEAIYDSPYGSTFYPCSHGFRRSFGVHTAMADINLWNGTVWFIEGDIKACFDTIDHHVLIELLRKRIQDDRFIKLIWKALRAGYMTFTEVFDSLVGTPQGSIISPILANIYLHELDEFVLGICRRESKGNKRGYNVEYKSVCARIAYLRKEQRKVGRLSEEKQRKLSDLKILQRSLPSQNTHDPNFCRVRYVRYADDWIVGITGEKLLAEWIRREIEIFLRNKLHMELSIDKTHITHAPSEYAHFLGTLIGTSSSAEQRVSSFEIKGTEAKKRAPRGTIQFRVPATDLVKKLADKGFCRFDKVQKRWFPTSKKLWVYLDEADIINLFSGVNRGLVTFYRFVDNLHRMGWIQYILLYSCAMTLAHKRRISVRKVMDKYGYKRQKTLSVNVVNSKGETREVKLALYGSFARIPRMQALKDAARGKPDTLGLANIFKTSRTRLFEACCLCGSDMDVEMHHVRHVRKMGETKGVTGFTKVMALMNRKQVPVCRECHNKIHRGEYDGVKVSSYTS